MDGWSKDKKHGGFTKTKKLTDGEVIGLLLSGTGCSKKDVLEKSYPSFSELAEARDKAMGLVVLALSLALLSYFEILKSFSSSGFEIGSNYLKHISLIFGSFSGVYFAIQDSKFMYFKVWFDHIFWSSSPSERSELLIRYPRAFDVFKYAESSIGFPPNIHPARYRFFMPLAVLTVIGLVFFVLASFALYVALAIDVWNSTTVNSLVSKVTVIGSGFVSILSATFPKHYHFRRWYNHYGLSNTLGKLRERDPERAKVFSRKIAEVRIRMVLTEGQ
jgi:hypothetical protein